MTPFTRLKKWVYQNLGGKSPEGGQSQRVRILEVYFQQRMTQTLHTAQEETNKKEASASSVFKSPAALFYDIMSDYQT